MKQLSHVHVIGVYSRLRFKNKGTKTHLKQKQMLGQTKELLEFITIRLLVNK